MKYVCVYGFIRRLKEPISGSAGFLSPQRRRCCNDLPPLFLTRSLLPTTSAVQEISPHHRNWNTHLNCSSESRSWSVIEIQTARLRFCLVPPTINQTEKFRAGEQKWRLPRRPCWSARPCPGQGYLWKKFGVSRLSPTIHSWSLYWCPKLLLCLIESNCFLHLASFSGRRIYLESSQL